MAVATFGCSESGPVEGGAADTERQLGAPTAKRGNRALMLLE